MKATIIDDIMTKIKVNDKDILCQVDNVVFMFGKSVQKKDQKDDGKMTQLVKITKSQMSVSNP